MSYLEKRTVCPACGGEEFKRVFEVPYDNDSLMSFLKTYYAKYDPSLLSGEVYQIDKCLNCTLLFQRFVPDERMLTVVYDQWIGLTSASQKPFAPSRKSRDAHEIFTISRFLNKPLSELEVLDYGMGLAKWCQTAQLLGCKVSGFDLADSRMEHARKLGINVVPWDSMSAQSVDFVNTEQVFEHLVDPYEVITKLASALKPNGIIKISVPHGTHMEARFESPDWMAPKYTSKSLNPLLPLEHINCWTRGSVDALAGRIGMKVVSRSLMDELAFVWRGAIPSSPKEFVRAFLRPAYKRWYPHKLYCWMQKPA